MFKVMKKLTFMACAAMLASTVALNSCKSDEPNGPKQQAEVVKAEFAISLPEKVAGSPRKMPAETVQEGSFQGITSIILVPFAKKGVIASGDTRLGDKNIHLTAGVAASGEGSLGTNSKAKVFSDVEVPLTTASFLFYAKSANVAEPERKFEDGSLLVDTASSRTTPGGFSFQLDSIITSDALNTLMTTGVGGQLLGLLSDVANASDGSASVHNKWYQYPNVDDSVAAHNLFLKYKSIHGLSSFEVARVLTDIYQTLKPSRTDMGIYDAILDVIDGATTLVTVNGTTGVVTMNSGYDKFPQSANLPAGSINIAWNEGEHIFKEGMYAGMAKPTKYVYPANLWYYANSTIATSNSSKKSMYDNSNSWETIVGAHTSGDEVKPLTRAIVLVDSVQYAVARFDTKVKLSAASLADNSDQVAPYVAVPVDCSGGFTVTAILVGGQNHVGFDFKPTADGAYSIYDTLMAASPMTASTSLSATNHTLVLETMANTDVRIAVEMRNDTGVDFYGVDNQLIPKNGKFYVIATLEADDATETGEKVFKQDYTTTAQLTLTSLKTAYNTLPDLRTPKLEIGFAVSLSWNSGHTYDVNFD